MSIDNAKELIDNLESVEKKSIVKPSVDKMLDSAPDFNVDLDDLENFPNSSVQSAIEQADIGRNDDILGKGFLFKIDVRLRELISKVFEKSHNFYIIVRDDKIVYANKSFLDAVDAPNCAAIYNDKFFKFIVKEDWNILAKNIGEMLTGDLSITVRLSALNSRILPTNFKAIYLQDSRHFTFILMGQRYHDRIETNRILYDDITGLPNYYLFEDRLAVAVNNELYGTAKKKSMIGTVVISIDNLPAFEQNGKSHVILRKIAEKLLFSLDKTYTVATGIKYQFWISIPNVKDEEALKEDVRRIAQIFEDTVHDGVDEHNIIASIGVSLFPKPSSSAGKLMNNAIKAVNIAQNDGGNKVVFVLE